MRSRCQHPVMLCWEERHRILQVPLILDGTPAVEFRAGPVPTGVGLIAAGDTVDLSFVITSISSVQVSAGSTVIFVCLTITGEMAPFSALHALYWFSFLFLGSDSCIAYVHPVSDEDVGGVC